VHPAAIIAALTFEALLSELPLVSRNAPAAIAARMPTPTSQTHDGI